MARYHRRKLLVDVKVQGAFLLRAAVYWALCLVMAALGIICWKLATHSTRYLLMEVDGFWFQFGPAFVVALACRARSY